MHLTLPRLGAIISLLIYFGFGLHHLTQFVTADEHYWIYERIPAYFEAIHDLKWKKTFINDKPGISLALISGIGLLFEPNPSNLVTEQADRTIHYSPDQADRLYLAFRLPLLIVNTLILFFLFWVIQKLYQETVAWLTLLFMTTSPILLGISQIVNPDALLWSFFSAALFSFLAWIRFQEQRWFFFALGFSSLALLTKYVALLLFPFYALVVIGQFFHNSKSSEIATSQLKKNIIALGLLFLGSLVLVTIFFPALWDKISLAFPFLLALPWYVQSLPLLGCFLLLNIFWFKNTFLIRIKHQLSPRRSKQLIASILTLLIFCLITPLILRFLIPQWDIFSLPFDIKDLSNARYYIPQPSFFEALLLEWHPLSATLTPLLLMGCLIAGFFAWKETSLLPFPIILFLLCYPVFFIGVNILLTPRYAITLYPLFALVAAFGFSSLWNAGTIHHLSLSMRALLLFFFVSVAASGLIFSAPFYLNYTNSLIPRSVLVSDAWGYGGFEAAQYMNTLPHAKNITVWADYYGFCEFFIGRCLTAYTFDPTVVKPDYYVLTRRGQIRYMSRYERWERLSGLVAYRYYQAPDPIWQLQIHNRPENFVKIYQVR